MISKNKTVECLGRLALLRFFPTNSHAVGEAGRLLNEACRSDQEADKLVGDVLRNHDEWPGPSCLRRPAVVKAFDPTQLYDLPEELRIRLRGE